MKRNVGKKMQKTNLESLKELNDNKVRVALVKELLDNPKGRLLLEWLDRRYAQNSVVMDNSNQTYFNLGQREVIREFKAYVELSIKKEKK